MRLWHKDLIPVLPRQQLLGQWRECCLIAKNIAEKGTPNHLLVNKILDYPDAEFNTYTHFIYCEMRKRDYKCNWNLYAKHRKQTGVLYYKYPIFDKWHNDRYLRQCLYNLQEKYDCGGISQDAWNKIMEVVNNAI